MGVGRLQNPPHSAIGAAACGPNLLPGLVKVAWVMLPARGAACRGRDRQRQRPWHDREGLGSSDWQIPWTDSMTQSYFRRIGRKEACDIVQGQRPDEDLIGCSFCDITPPFIRWREEMSLPAVQRGGWGWNSLAAADER